jgi:hypothetical protein
MLVQIMLLINREVMKSATTGLHTLQGSIFSTQASLVSINEASRLYCELVKLEKFDFNADLDPVFNYDADPGPQPCY